MVIDEFHNFECPSILQSTFIQELSNQHWEKSETAETSGYSSSEDQSSSSSSSSFDETYVEQKKRRGKNYRKKNSKKARRPPSKHQYEELDESFVDISEMDLHEGDAVYVLPKLNLFPEDISSKFDANFIKDYPYFIFQVVSMGEDEIVGRRLYRHYDLAFLVTQSLENILTLDVNELYVEKEGLEKVSSVINVNTC